jgi:hypothetical protein
MATVRILIAEEPASTTITLDGPLLGDALDQVRNCCTQALSKAPLVRLYLRDVAAIDECGRTLLRDLASQGVDLSAKGIYSSYIVDEIRTEGLSKRRGSR